MSSLKDKIIVVTGAGGVLCSMFAKEAAKQGAKVALLDLNVNAAQAAADEITQTGGCAKGYEANVLQKESLQKAHEQILADFGKCDILINGAGGNHPKATTTKEYFEEGDIEAQDVISFFDLEPENVGFVFNLNFLGTLLPTQVFAPDMLGKGTILNIASMNAYRPLTKITAYSCAKAAIVNFTQWLAVHFAKNGIRVNAMAPGFFVTNQNRGLLFDEQGNPTARTKKILDHTPMGRFGEPEDLLGTLNFLLDDNASAFVTGVTIPVDGGFAAYSGV